MLRITKILMTTIQFIQGMDEEVTAEVRLTRSVSGNNGTAKFTFEKPKAFTLFEKSKAFRRDVREGITGMHMIDEEGEMISREVKAKFVNGEPKFLEVEYVMKSRVEWDRFMRFMERYAKEHGLEFNKA